MKKIIFLIIILKISICRAGDFLLIDKAEKILKIYKNNQLIASYKVGMGLESLLPKEKRGDFLTPEGIYKIIKIRPSKQYKYFLALNYPNLNDLSLAYYKGIFNKETFSNLLDKLRKNKILNTSLGNGIGIHGGGAYRLEKRNSYIYKNYNWTKGCIALNNKDLLKLLNQIYIKEKVIIINSKKSLFEILKKLAYPVKIKPLEFWQGELYLKLNNFTFINFYITEYYKGIKYLTVETWYKGYLIERLKTNGLGKFKNIQKEKKLKKLLLENLANILNPYKNLEF
ncbi:L,D-transpeptidase family protein [Thermodesulfobacterium hydrogeniphilum]|uniref:L,D-transpeptidase family protein n=1 Tax=Thermodesulfobacterium hydrogeniphilum TaxID=161156 RepID=UPI00057005F8|nr:L,D-transpeptidase family protein [Thermodesulfobacterium hydrogeniphilum]